MAPHILAAKLLPYWPAAPKSCTRLNSGGFSNFPLDHDIFSPTPLKISPTAFLHPSTGVWNLERFFPSLFLSSFPDSFLPFNQVSLHSLVLIVVRLLLLFTSPSTIVAELPSARRCRLHVFLRIVPCRISVSVANVKFQRYFLLVDIHLSSTHFARRLRFLESQSTLLIVRVAQDRKHHRDITKFRFSFLLCHLDFCGLHPSVLQSRLGCSATLISLSARLLSATSI